MDFASPSVLSRLLSLLSWKDEPDIIEALDALHIHRIAAAFKDAVTRLVASGYLDSIVFANKFQQLSCRAFYRLLCAPEICATVSTAGSAQFPAHAARVLLDTMDTELALQDDLVPETSGQWTALGDYFVTASPPRNLLHCLTRYGRYSFRGPHVGSDIPIDLGYSDTPFYARANFQHAVALNPEELASTISRIETALAKMGAVSSAANQFVEKFTKGLVLVKDLGRSHQFSSWSSSGAIGRSVLVNPHIPSADEAALADTILHESIHGMLCIAELQSTFVRSVPEALNTDIVSPWTGARLKLSAYLHACLVWFGLWWFWCAARRTEAFPRDRVDSRIEFTAAGFRKEALVQLFDTCTPYVCSGVVHAIAEAQEIVLGHSV
jgi:hypothetical protein